MTGDVLVLQVNSDFYLGTYSGMISAESIIYAYDDKGDLISEWTRVDDKIDDSIDESYSIYREYFYTDDRLTAISFEMDEDNDRYIEYVITKEGDYSFEENVIQSELVIESAAEEETYRYRSGSKSYVDIVEYDSKGRITYDLSQIDVGSNGSVDSYSENIYEYNEENALTYEYYASYVSKHYTDYGDLRHEEHTSYVYDENGHLVLKTQETTSNIDLSIDKIITTSYDYDDDGNLILEIREYNNRKDSQIEQTINLYSYDENGGLVLYTQKHDYDFDGQIDAITNTTYNYDATDQLVSSLSEHDTDNDGGIDQADSYLYVYDADGSLIYSAHDYDGENDGIPDERDVYAWKYNANGQLVFSVEMANISAGGVTENVYVEYHEYDFDGSLILTVESQHNYTEDGDTLSSQEVYQYDANGNLVFKSDSDYLSTSVLNDLRYIWHYEYDLNGNLISEVYYRDIYRDGYIDYIEQDIYAYDPNGNLVFESVEIDDNGNRIIDSFSASHYSYLLATATHNSDFNEDRMGDIVWHNPFSGTTTIAHLSNGKLGIEGTSTLTVTNVPGTVAGVGDFDGDGKEDDLVWLDEATGQLTLTTTAYDDGVTLTETLALGWMIPASGWTLVGAVDGDQDGLQDDLLWANATSQEVYYWYLEAGTVVGGGVLFTGLGAEWELVGAGEFHGDGIQDDLVFRNSLTGENGVWLMAGGTVTGYLALDPVTDLAWNIAGISDFNGDGVASDILWHNRLTGDLVIWNTDSGQVTSDSFVGNVGGAGQVVV